MMRLRKLNFPARGPVLKRIWGVCAHLIHFGLPTGSDLLLWLIIRKNLR